MYDNDFLFWKFIVVIVFFGLMAAIFAVYRFYKMCTKKSRGFLKKENDNSTDDEEELVVFATNLLAETRLAHFSSHNSVLCREWFLEFDHLPTGGIGGAEQHSSTQIYLMIEKELSLRRVIFDRFDGNFTSSASMGKINNQSAPASP
ncbi:hypothetical protein GCK72_025976 [Caenorhabditis remanei]|uniref:Uncharacterized protein n=1 Tax=Caenorhabditis remanei TaxID=31234 RepID=A0A6A5G3E1_CAERE|nr:hypothetical protein GCK72_025976 [Caenorhabditis remanei]KAF1749508.1 hypothetical protein GCK72_025976 [Caenorhabditis remanei]